MPASIVILGAGNILAGDDGVGVHAIRTWGEEMMRTAGVRALEIGTLGPATLALLRRRERVILIDAVRGDGRPGSIYRLNLSDVEPPQIPPLSMHELGVPHLLREARLLGRPLRGILFGVEPANLDAATAALSPDVARAIPRLRELVLKEIRRMAGAPRGAPQRLRDQGA